VAVCYLQAMRSQMENPEDLEGLQERKGSTSEGDARNVVKQILTFALTEQVRNWFNALQQVMISIKVSFLISLFSEPDGLCCN
jgi:hypothetical protein